MIDCHRPVAEVENDAANLIVRLSQGGDGPIDIVDSCAVPYGVDTLPLGSFG